MSALLISDLPALDTKQLIILGDSRAAQSRALTNSASAVSAYEGQTSILRYALDYAGERLYYPDDGSFAYTAFRTLNLVNGLAHPDLSLANFGVDTPVTHLAGYAVVWIGINDINNDVPLATMQGRLLCVLDALQHKTVFLLNEVPVGVNESGGVQNNLTGTRLTNFVAWHTWINTLASSKVIIVDTWNEMLDPATDGTTYRPLSGYLHDGLHCNSAGARKIGQKLGQAIIDNVPAFDYSFLPINNSDAYNVSTAPYGCLNSNPLIPRGSNGGTKTSGGAGSVTGNVCTGYTVRTTTDAGALDVTCSQGDGGDGYDEQIISWSGTTEGSGLPSIVFYQDLNTANFGASDKLLMAARVKFDASSLVGVDSIGAYAFFASGGTPPLVQAKSFDRGDVAGFYSGMGAVAVNMVVSPVKRVRLGGSLTSASARIRLDFPVSTATSGTIKVSRFGARRFQY